MKRSVFYVSDSTALTVESLGHTALSQFNIECVTYTFPFVDNIERAMDVRLKINDAAEEECIKPLVFYTIVDPKIRALIDGSDGFCHNILDAIVKPLENELGVRHTPEKSKPHGLSQQNLEKYDERIAAIEYALVNDDGITLKNLDQANIILLGVSRCGKTPTSLYLAMQFGVFVMNYPFIADDMDQLTLPRPLLQHKDKLFGLTIDPDRLSSIREERLENSRYASLRQCRLELGEVETLYQRQQIPYLNTTNMSIEEIATKILDTLNIKRNTY